MKVWTSRLGAVLGMFGVAFSFACDSEPNGPIVATADSTATGGVLATGGLLPKTGGLLTTGGVPASGGNVASTGGADVSGGAADSGGVGATDGDEFASSGLWCAAREVFQQRCQSCHGVELVSGAPMPLVSHADTQGQSVLNPDQSIPAMIGIRIHDATRPMPPLGGEPLSAEQLAALDAWLASGTPDGECGTPDAVEEKPEEEFTWPEECEEIYEIRASDGQGGPYVVPANAELNHDFTIPVPWAGSGSGEVQALAIRPLTSNKRVVHHWILYAGTLDFITSWSPGKPDEIFDDHVGVYMPTSGNFRLNMHYYNVGNSNDEADDSGLEVCITRKLRPNTATTYMFFGNATVPPLGRTENVTECTVRATEPVHLITSSPHMHSYGVGAKFEVLRQNGTVEVLEDAPFNWENQHINEIDMVIDNGDRMRVTCIYQNDTAQTIRFGSSSADEMCFNFARYYPKGALTCR